MRLAFTVVLLWSLSCAAQPAVMNPGTAVAPSRYMFTAFTNTSESNMFVYQSPDALHYTLLKGPAYTPHSGLVRDPSLMQHIDGLYYIAYTTGWTGADFGIASSPDLMNWTFVRNVPVQVAGVTSVWAPEWFKDPADGSINIIVSLLTNDAPGRRGHRLLALNDQLSVFSPGRLLTGFGPNTIDHFIVKVGPTYHVFCKNETTKFIEHATAAKLDGPYTFVGTGDWAGWGGDLEGPSLMRLANGHWRLYMDAYQTGHYYVSDSADLVTWTPKVELPASTAGQPMSGFVRHGTVHSQNR